MVFIEAKYAHKMSAPARTSVRAQNVTILDDALVLVAASPSLDERFSLSLKFSHPIDRLSSTWSASSVGRVTFSLVKRTALHWDELLAPSQPKPSNMLYWWDMQVDSASRPQAHVLPVIEDAAILLNPPPPRSGVPRQQ
jgi:hypothetical protein